MIYNRFNFVTTKLLVLLILSFTSSLSAVAQYPGWQQQADYKMDITLDTATHSYSGEMTVEYYNNSPDDLNRVFWHAFFNAFRPGSMMDVRSRNIPDPDRRVGSRILSLPEDEWGAINPVSLTMNGTPVPFAVEGTIIVADLPSTLVKGSSCTFNMVWEAQIPKQIRRSGWMNSEGVEYSMTQWFPKLCEYDHEGWHSNPYVGREFHGIWGNYDVTLHTPPNYHVSATGLLQPSSTLNSNSKSWHFIAENVIDFAWVADPDFIEEIAIVDGITMKFVHQASMGYDSVWSELPAYATKAMAFFNDFIGKYPYAEYTVAQGGDGGMEYPMMTLISGNRSLPSLVGVTVHEMGHSWFQAVVATNESLYEWMDEGFTSWIESKCMQSLFPSNMGAAKVGGDHAYSYSSYIDFALSGKEEPLITHADHYSINRAYGIAAYSKGQVLVEQIGAIIGNDTRDEGMREYFRTWSFKHPGPTDFKRVMERISGIELDWYFQYFINTTHTIDYSITEVSNSKGHISIELSRIGTMPMPQDLMITYKDGTSSRYHIPLVIMRGNRTLLDNEMLADDWAWTNPKYTLNYASQGRVITSVELDPQKIQADVDRKNNLVEFKSKLRQTYKAN